MNSVIIMKINAAGRLLPGRTICVSSIYPRRGFCNSLILVDPPAHHFRAPSRIANDESRISNDKSSLHQLK